MFGFLKNKLKEWVDTAKDKLKSEEPSDISEEEIDVSKEPSETEKKVEKKKNKSVGHFNS